MLGREKLTIRLASAKVNAIDLVLGYAALARVVKTTSAVDVLTEDPEDNAVLECALAAKADVIASGDRHLLKLKRFRKIQILTPDELLSQIV